MSLNSTRVGLIRLVDQMEKYRGRSVFKVRLTQSFDAIIKAGPHEVDPLFISSSNTII